MVNGFFFSFSDIDSKNLWKIYKHQHTRTRTCIDLRSQIWFFVPNLMLMGVERMMKIRWTILCLLVALNAAYCLDLLIVEELPVGTVIADLWKDGKLFDQQWIMFRMQSIDEFARGLVEVSHDAVNRELT